MNRHLQFVLSTDTQESWTVQPQQNTSKWPLADAPNAPLSGTASSNSTDFSIYLHYFSGQKMIQVRMSDYNWQPFSIVGPPDNKTVPANGTANLNPNSDSPLKLKPVEIAAVILGSIGFLASLFIVGMYFDRKKDNNTAKSMIDSTIGRENAASISTPYIGKAELHGEDDIIELDHDPGCLLLHQLQLRRKHELGAPIPVELDSSLCQCELSTTVRYELDATERYEMPAWSEKLEEQELSRVSAEEWTAKLEARANNIGSTPVEEHSSSLGVEGDLVLPIWSWAMATKEKHRSCIVKEDDSDMISPFQQGDEWQPESNKKRNENDDMHMMSPVDREETEQPAPKDLQVKEDDFDLVSPI
jgi:hypothetical protein